MSEIRPILDAASELRRAGEPFLVATVVRVRGSAYRRPGARMLLTRDRWIAGSLSGGCVEGDVLRKAWWRTQHGAPTVVTYDTSGGSDEGVALRRGLGCEGVVDVLLEREGDGSDVVPLDFIASCVATQRRGALATCLAGAHGLISVGARIGLRSDGSVALGNVDDTIVPPLLAECSKVIANGSCMSMCVSVGEANVDFLVESILPPVRFFVLGSGHDVVPLVAVARTLGWDAIVHEPAPRVLSRDRFGDALLVASHEDLAAYVDASDRAVAVLMAHDYERDKLGLDALLRTRALYIGALGPRRRTMRMLGELGIQVLDARLHAPVGLDLGAETPAEIALSIAAEAQATLTRSSAERLRHRCASIHAPASHPEAAE